eukprot:gene244-biopygen6079
MSNLKILDKVRIATGGGARSADAKPQPPCPRPVLPPLPVVPRQLARGRTGWGADEVRYSHCRKGCLIWNKSWGIA